MSRSSAFAIRTLWSTVAFGAGLGVIRLASAKPVAPIAGLIAVAIAAGMLLETLRWKQGRYRVPLDRDQVLLVAGIGVLIWAIGLGVDVHSGDRGAVVIGGTVAAAVVVYTFNFLPHHRGV